MHLGIALGTALTALAFFATTNGSPDAALNRDAFRTVLRWVTSLPRPDVGPDVLPAQAGWRPG
ncbi:hypothetical protein LT493_41755 [Streptomyces tricolor]|nr:hypothetical protein [Streptomyces tricolor]